MKKIALLIYIIVTLLLASANAAYVRAQTNTPSAPSPTVPATSIIMSDYALDVQQGKQSVNNDIEAQNNQKKVIDNESIEAHEETEAVEPVEKIEPKEAVEPQEAVESESEGKKNDKENGSEGLKQESDFSSESSKKSDSENKQTDSEKSGENIENAPIK